jgi:hypothetical protein
VYGHSAVSLLESFWARFGWNHVALSRPWYWGLGAVTALGAAGAIVSTVRFARDERSVPAHRAVTVLALAGGLVWVNAFLRAHPFLQTALLPTARYTYPAIVPTVLGLTVGWWTLTPARSRRWYLPALFGLLGMLDVRSLWLLFSTFYGR